jgi:four helix bundle protein
VLSFKFLSVKLAMAYQSFEELEVWQRGCRLAVKIFQAFADCKCVNLKNQIERAGLSIPSNIAEGAERGGAREFSHFLKIAKGSFGELRTQLYIASKLNLLEASLIRQLVRESREVSSMLEGLRKSIARSREANQL